MPLLVQDGNNTRSNDDKVNNCRVAVRIRPLSRVETLQNPSFSVEWDCE